MGGKIVCLVLALSLGLIPSLTNGAEQHSSPEVFYKGKMITLIVCTSPGGGYDFYGRLMAQYMQNYLPGSTIIVKNVPGGGNIIGVNEIYRSKPDGLTFGIFSKAIPLAQVVGEEGVKFDVSKMSWLGSVGQDPTTFFVSTKSSFRNLNDVMKADKVYVASSGPGTEGHILAILFARVAGLKNFTVIPNYRGSEAELAMLRGEVDGEFAQWSSLESFYKEGNAVPVLVLAKEPVKGHERVALIGGVIKEERDRPLAEFMISVSTIGRSFAGPPGIPEDRLAILREAFVEALKDKKLQEVAKKTNRPVDFASGEETARMVKNITQLSPELLEIIKKAYGK